MNVIAIGHNRLDFIKRRIIDGHERATKGGAEWVEGSLQLAAAMLEGRDAVPANIAFSQWLKDNGLAFYSAENRHALIKLAQDLELARIVLTETTSRSYQLIWRENKSRYCNSTKTPTRKRTRVYGRGMILRTMKLGEELMAKIAGTSLDSAMEMDELIILNRGAPEGGHTAIVQQLVADAAAGKAVSAIADSCTKHKMHRASSSNIAAAWKKRMVAAWKLANREQRIAFVISLIRDLEHADQDKIVEAIWDREKEGTT